MVTAKRRRQDTRLVAAAPEGVIGMATARRSNDVRDERVLELTRKFDAPRATVFAAWTDAEHLASWWGPRGYTALACQADVRVGGTWRVASRSPEGSEHTAGGVYREIVAPERLVFTMAWEGMEDGEPGRETLVTVSFAEEGAGTRMTFQQSVFSSREACDGHDEGWSSAFELLAEYLAK
jgi:uncharacterized protein YndB with AHSA1/START domain